MYYNKQTNETDRRTEKSIKKITIKINFQKEKYKKSLIAEKIDILIKIQDFC